MQLLESWDQAARHVPPPTQFDNSHISGICGGENIQTLTAAGATLTLGYAGVTTPRNHDCGYDYTASAPVSSRAVAVSVQADPGTWPSGPDVACASTVAALTLTITLPQPLGNRSVLDTATGSALN